MEIDIVTQNFTADDYMSRFFAEYCMTIRGPLFQDPDQYLSDRSFRTLKQKIIEFCQPPAGTDTWTYQKCRSTRTSFDWKYFYRCFGIFLREATLRYGKSITQGQFWKDINDSAEISLFNKGTLEEIIKLDDGYNRTLFYNTYREFRDQDIKYPLPKKGQSNDYVGHLLKISVLPFNLNPFKYTMCHQAYLMNNLGIFISNARQNSLSKHPATKELLTRKINDFFVYYENLKNFPLTTQKEQLENFYGISKQCSWMYDWLDQASNTHAHIPTNLTPEQLQENIRKIQQRLRNNSIKQSRILLRLYGEQDIRYQTKQSIDSLAILFLEIFNDTRQNHRLTDKLLISLEDDVIVTIQNKRFVNISNDAVEKLFTSKKLSVTINNIVYENLDNPWFTGRNWHILDYTGTEKTRLAVDANHHCYIVIPKGKQISHYYTDFANQNRINPEPLQRIESFNVYPISADILQNADTLLFTLSNGEKFRIEVEDPSYLRLHQKTENNVVVGPTKFIFQQKIHKIGIGKIEFSIKTLNDIENADYNNIINNLKAAYITGNALNADDIDVEIQENSLNGIEYLCLVNRTTNILELKEKDISNTQYKLPAITLFPHNVEIWVAKKSNNPDDYFCPFINGTIENLSNNWTDWNTKDGCCIHDEGANWLTSGANVKFADSEIYLHAPYLTIRAEGANNNDQSRSIPMYNGVFGSLIPENAQYYFEWIENGSMCKAKSIQAANDTNNGKTIRDAYHDLDINGAAVIFGWEYKNSYFVSQYQQANDYAGPRVQRQEDFYTRSEEDRFDILSNTVSNGLYLKNELANLINQYADLFQQDSALKDLCGACKTTTEMRNLISNRLARLDPNYNSNRIQKVINEVYKVLRQCISAGTIPQGAINGNPILQDRFNQANTDEYVRERVLFFICKRNSKWIQGSDRTDDDCMDAVRRMDAVYNDVFEAYTEETLSAMKRQTFANPLTQDFINKVFKNI